MRSLFSLAVILSFFLACKKEDPIINPIEPTTIDLPPVYVPVYFPGDTAVGACHAKKLTASWRAAVKTKNSPENPDLFSAGFFTYSSFGAHKETFGFNGIPKSGIGSFKVLDAVLTDEIKPGEVTTGYGIWASDGDVLEDTYRLDTLASDNNLTITYLDLPARRVEGTFTVSFNIREPRRNPANLKKVKFSDGRFWAVLTD